MGTNTKPHRRWFQISLRTLLLLVTVAACGFGWVGYKVRQAQRQKEAVEAIEKLGGFAAYDFECDSNLNPIDSPTPPGPAWLRQLVGDAFFGNVVRVDLFRTPMSDAGLVHLEGFNKLRYLVLGNTQITDAGMVHLQGLSQLTILVLFNTQLTNEGLAHVEALSQLEYLFLSNTKVTDAGLLKLKGLRQIEWLDLSKTQITDAGLVHLRGLTQLRKLFLEDTQVTDAGCQELKKSLPNVEITR